MKNLKKEIQIIILKDKNMKKIQLVKKIIKAYNKVIKKLF